MLTRKIDMERLTVVSFKPFDAVVSAVEQSIGHPNIAELGRAASDSTPFSELERMVNHGVSASGLMLFMTAGCGSGAAQGKRPSVAKSGAFSDRQSPDHE